MILGISTGNSSINIRYLEKLPRYFAFLNGYWNVLTISIQKTLNFLGTTIWKNVWCSEIYLWSKVHNSRNAQSGPFLFSFFVFVFFYLYIWIGLDKTFLLICNTTMFTYSKLKKKKKRTFHFLLARYSFFVLFFYFSFFLSIYLNRPWQDLSFDM